MPFYLRSTASVNRTTHAAFLSGAVAPVRSRMMLAVAALGVLAALSPDGSEATGVSESLSEPRRHRPTRPAGMVFSRSDVDSRFAWIEDVDVDFAVVFRPAVCLAVGLYLVRCRAAPTAESRSRVSVVTTSSLSAATLI